MTLASPVAFPHLANFVTLPGGSARGLGHVDASAALDCIVSPIFFKTGSAVSGAATVVLYIVTAEEIVTQTGSGWTGFTDGIDPDLATGSQHTLIADATQANGVQMLGGADSPLVGNTYYCFRSFSLKSELGFVPHFWAPLIWARTGTGNSLSATSTDFYAKYSILT